VAGDYLATAFHPLTTIYPLRGVLFRVHFPRQDELQLSIPAFVSNLVMGGQPGFGRIVGVALLH